MIRWVIMGLACSALVAPLWAQEEGTLPHGVARELFGQRPKSFLMDTGRALAGEDFREQLEFLEYHSGDSAIDLYVLVFKGDEPAADRAEIDRAVDGWSATGKPAVVACYFMGRPDRASLHVCPALDAVVPVAEQARARDTAVARAAEESLMSSQLGKFLVELSIRIYWMERQLQQAGKPAAAAVAFISPVLEPPSKKEFVLTLARIYALPAAAALAAVGLLAASRVWLKRRARYRFPDLVVEPRLGGPHAAGVGAVITFATAAVPPAAQRGDL